MVTVIIPTSNTAIDYLCWCLFSLALRGEDVSRVIVNINGPDERYTSVYSQNLKQRFVEEFKDVAPFEVILMRTWSRVGFAQPIKQALPLVETDHYVIMQDDVFITDPDWVKQGLNKDTDIVVAWPKYKDQFNFSRPTLIFPRSNLQFVMAKKEITEWDEYYFQQSFDFHRWKYAKDFITHYQQKCQTGIGEGYHYLRTEDGNVYVLNAWDKEPNYKSLHYPPGFMIFPNKSTSFWDAHTICHLSGRSIRPPETVDVVDGNIFLPEIDSLEREIRRSKYSLLYNRYSDYAKKRRPEIVFLKESSTKFSSPEKKVLVCLGLYKRYFYANCFIESYHQSDKQNSKLMVLHHLDQVDYSKIKVDTTKVDWYILKPNLGTCAGVVQYTMGLDIDWDYFISCTDDSVILNKDFIQRMIAPFEDESVGITYAKVPNLIKEYSDSIKTGNFCIKKSVANMLRFNSYPELQKDDLFNFEHGAECMSNQIREAGYKTVEVSDALTEYYFTWERISQTFDLSNLSKFCNLDESDLFDGKNIMVQNH